MVADGLPLFRGSQLATDTTVVPPLYLDGSVRRGAATKDGEALGQAHTYPELAGEGDKSRRVGGGGRWSDETAECKKAILFLYVSILASPAKVLSIILPTRSRNSS